jgi:hypothetical protein
MPMDCRSMPSMMAAAKHSASVRPERCNAGACEVVVTFNSSFPGKNSPVKVHDCPRCSRAAWRYYKLRLFVDLSG